MAADFSIKWLPEDKRFEPATINAELTQRGRDLDMPMEVKEINLDPPSIIDVTVDPEQSSETVVVLKAELTAEVLADEEFYERIKQPVEVEVVAHPLAAETAAAITAGSTEIRKKCTVDVAVPPPTIHWRDLEHPELGEDPVIEVEADGEDELALEVWLERYIPARRAVDKDDTIHFSHMTGPMFRPRIFGPHPDSLPWEEAPPGSANRRTRSRWKSNAYLPAEKHPETVPLDGHIRVRAWGPKDITGRRPNAIDTAADKHVGEHNVPVRLVPIGIEARKIEPAEPIPANGTPTDVLLEFRRTRTGALLKQGEVSWELAVGERYPGGTVDPTSAVLAEADGGRARFAYTVARKVYEPAKSWDQDLKVFSGNGEKRRELKGVVLWVSPEIRAELLGEKKGLDFEPPYSLVISAADAPCEIVGHHGFVSLEEDAADDLHVYDALPHVKVLAESGECEVQIEKRTDEGGLFTWHLPELAPGLEGLAEDRRKRNLAPFKEESAGDFDERGLDLLKQYRAYLNTAAPRAVLDRLLTPDHMQRLREQPMVMGRHLSCKPEADCEKAQEGTVIVLSALRGTVLVDGLHGELFDKGLDLIVKFAWDALDIVIKVTKIGEKIAHWVGESSAYQSVSGWLQRAFRMMVSPLISLRNAIQTRSPQLAGAIDRVIDAMDTRGSLPDSLRHMANEAQAKIAAGLIEVVQKIERAVVGIAVSEHCLGEALHYGGKKSAEKIVKEMSKKLQKLLSGQAGTFNSYAELKAWLRSDLPGLGLEDTAQSVIATTAANVANFSYQYDPAACERYLRALTDLQNRNVSLDANISVVDEAVSTVDLACDLLALGAVIAAVLSAGTATIVSFTFLSALTIPKALAKATVHAFQGLQLLAAAFNLVDLYEQETTKLTQVSA